MAKTVELKRKRRPAPRSAVTVSVCNPDPEPAELPDGMWQQIEQKAFELYKASDMREGHTREDCLRRKPLW